MNDSSKNGTIVRRPMLTIPDTLRSALPELDLRQEGGELIASPRTTEEISALLRQCNLHDISIEISGAGTKRHWSGPSEAQLVLATSGLAGVREHPWQDLTATVGAGTRWADMERVLATHGQFVALDPLWPERATVGGVLSTNDSGALRLRYGSARDLVIGMTLVLADGTVAKTGGKVVKNVAGYDLHKLMLGAFGTLAVISEVTFRLHPLPAARKVWSVTSASIEPIANLSAAITTSYLNPEAVQIRTTSEGFSMDVQLAAPAEVLRAKRESFATMVASQGLSAREITEGVDVFRARERLFELPNTAVTKITTLQTAVRLALHEIAQTGAQALAYPLGILYAAFPSPQAIPLSVRSLVAECGGSITAIGDAGEPTKLMREIQAQFGSACFR